MASGTGIPLQHAHHTCLKGVPLHPLETILAKPSVISLLKKIKSLSSFGTWEANLLGPFYSELILRLLETRLACELGCVSRFWKSSSNDRRKEREKMERGEKEASVMVLGSWSRVTSLGAKPPPIR